MSARLPIEELKELIDIEIEQEDEDDFETVGGLICTKLGRIPVKGEKVKYAPNIEFEILDADPRKIKKLKAHIINNYE